MLIDYRELALYGWIWVGFPAALLGFCMSGVKPVLRLVCGVELFVLLLIMVAASAIYCDGPFALMAGCYR